MTFQIGDEPHTLYQALVNWHADPEQSESLTHAYATELLRIIDIYRPAHEPAKAEA